MTLSGFHKKSFEERFRLVKEKTGLTAEDEAALLSPTEFLKVAEEMSENVLGVASLPLGIATNFVVNGKERLIPMATEECSVVAAASNGAKLALPEGFSASTSGSTMIGQVQIVGARRGAAAEIMRNKREMLREANSPDELIVKMGGGAKDIEVRTLDNGHLVVHFLVDVMDAMGANVINAMMERAAPLIADASGGKMRARIVSNLAVERLAKASAVWRKDTLIESFHGDLNASPDEVIDAILDVHEFAEFDPFRAATHNKGIMNGIDAVAVATGNDWRAVEAGAHSFAAISGRYLPLTKYGRDDDGNLCGEIMLPLTLATVGKSISGNPMARASLRIIGARSSAELCQVAASVGLAQNFAALRVLATEGIQKGHARLHSVKIRKRAQAKA